MKPIWRALTALTWAAVFLLAGYGIHLWRGLGIAFVVPFGWWAIVFAATVAVAVLAPWYLLDEDAMKLLNGAAMSTIAWRQIARVILPLLLVELWSTSIALYLLAHERWISGLAQR